MLSARDRRSGGGPSLRAVPEDVFAVGAAVYFFHVGSTVVPIRLGDGGAARP